MNIIFHIPENTNEEKQLDTLIAKAHADAIIEYIKASPYTQKEKALLLKTLIQLL